MTTGAAGGRLDPAFDVVLLSPFGGAAEGDCGASAGALDDFASFVAGTADFSSTPFGVSALTAGVVTFDSAVVRADEAGDNGGASMRVSVSLISGGSPKNLYARYPLTANSPTMPMTTTTNPAFLGFAL